MYNKRNIDLYADQWDLTLRQLMSYIYIYIWSTYS